MSELNPCRKCGGPAVEHIRGEFHAKSRDDVEENRHPGALLVSMDKSIEDDFRLACSKVKESDFLPKTVGGWGSGVFECENFLPWCQPTLKEVRKQYELWNTLNPKVS
jgi:hypothetical protein